MNNTLTHLACPGVILNSDTTISQILAMLHNSGYSLATPCITLNLVSSKRNYYLLFYLNCMCHFAHFQFKKKAFL